DNAQKHGKPGGAVIIGAQTRAGSNDLDFVDITVTNSRKTDSRPSTITTEAVSGTKIIQSACSLIGATWSFCITGDDAIAVIADIPSVRSKNQQQSEE
ncbi:MAG: hypothetical protein HUU55_14765, partial [Myxococcales bacterium]|nr:hypothetical protein [Myxococcales bacterium]